MIPEIFRTSYKLVVLEASQNVTNIVTTFHQEPSRILGFIYPFPHMLYPHSFQCPLHASVLQTPEIHTRSPPALCLLSPKMPVVCLQNSYHQDKPRLRHLAVLHSQTRD